MMCMVHNPVGVSGNTGRVYFEESCEVVDYQLKSGLEEQQKRPHVSVRRMEIVRKEHSKGSIMFLTTRKDMREIPEVLS